MTSLRSHNEARKNHSKLFYLNFIGLAKYIGSVSLVFEYNEQQQQHDPDQVIHRLCLGEMVV